MWGGKKEVTAKIIEVEIKTRGTIPDHLTIFTHSFNQQTFNKGLMAQSLLLDTRNTAVDKSERVSALSFSGVRQTRKKTHE